MHLRPPSGVIQSEFRQIKLHFLSYCIVSTTYMRRSTFKCISHRRTDAIFAATFLFLAFFPRRSGLIRDVNEAKLIDADARCLRPKPNIEPEAETKIVYQRITYKKTATNCLPSVILLVYSLLIVM